MLLAAAGVIEWRFFGARGDVLRFNGPNDVVYHSNGRLYFTDPDTFC